jgi:hypothetical protein
MKGDRQRKAAHKARKVKGRAQAEREFQGGCRRKVEVRRAPAPVLGFHVAAGALAAAAAISMVKGRR